VDPVRGVLAAGLLYFIHAFSSQSSRHLSCVDQMAELEDKARRLQSSKEDAKRQKAFIEDRLREAEVRVKRGDDNEIKVESLSRQVLDLREAARKCHTDVEQLQDCKSGRDLMSQELGLREEVIHVLKERLRKGGLSTAEQEQHSHDHLHGEV